MVARLGLWVFLILVLWVFCISVRLWVTTAGLRVFWLGFPWVCVVQIVVGVCGFRRFWSGAGFVCLVCGLGWIGLFGLRVDVFLFLWVS